MIHDFYDECENYVREVRGAWDAPGFDACVRSEVNSRFEKIVGQRDELLEALRICEQNDKTPPYDYNGSNSVNRNGQNPGAGKRWNTPREIARAALAKATKD